MNGEQGIRAALQTTTNITSAYDPTYGVEIEKKVMKEIVEILNRSTPIKALIPRESLNGQLTFRWNIRTAGNTSATFFSEGGSGTAATGVKKQLYAVPIAMRADWSVTRTMQAGSASYYNAMADEMKDAATELALLEEKQIVDGTDSSAYGDANGFQGMKELIDSFTNSVASNTDTVFGDTRAGGKTYLDCQLETVGGALALSNLDNAISQLEVAGGVPGFFLCSPFRRDQINSLLQAQQRFVNSIEIAGGFRVISYNNIPIITSRFMDKAGETDTDTVMYLAGANNFVMKVLREYQNYRVADTREDVEGGYLVAEEVLVCKDLTKNVRINSLTAV